jgi:hypothetical protein
MRAFIKCKVISIGGHIIFYVYKNLIGANRIFNLICTTKTETTIYAAALKVGRKAWFLPRDNNKKMEYIDQTIPIAFFFTPFSA